MITEENLQNMASAVAEHIWLLQSQLDAAKNWILDQPGAPTREKLDSQLFQRDSNLRNRQTHRDKSAEFQRVIQSQDDAEDILRSLHNLVTTGKMKA